MTLLTRKELADFTGFAEGTLSKWAKLGMPVKRDGASGSEWKANSAHVVAWLLERERAKVTDTADVSEQRARLLKAQAAMAEMDVAEREGRTCPTDDVQRCWAEVTVQCRTRLLQLPRTAPPLLPLINGRRAEAEETLRKLVYEALNELAGAGDGVPLDTRARAAKHANGAKQPAVRK